MESNRLSKFLFVYKILRFHDSRFVDNPSNFVFQIKSGLTEGAKSAREQLTRCPIIQGYCSRLNSYDIDFQTNNLSWMKAKTTNGDDWHDRKMFAKSENPQLFRYLQKYRGHFFSCFLSTSLFFTGSRNVFLPPTSNSQLSLLQF